MKLTGQRSEGQAGWLGRRGGLAAGGLRHTYQRFSRTWDDQLVLGYTGGLEWGKG